MKKTKTEVEFEEILKQVTPFIINLSKGAVGCVEFEDMQQILMIHTWETWQSYDASKGAQFFTYLYPSLRRRRAMEMRTRCAQRRDWRKEGGSLDAPVDAAKDETCTFTNFVADMNGSNDPVERLYGSEISRIVYGVVNKQSSEQARKAMLLHQKFKRRCIWLLGRPTEAAKKANENAFQTLVHSFLRYVGYVTAHDGSLCAGNPRQSS